MNSPTFANRGEQSFKWPQHLLNNNEMKVEDQRIDHEFEDDKDGRGPITLFDKINDTDMSSVSQLEGTE